GAGWSFMRLGESGLGRALDTAVLIDSDMFLEVALVEHQAEACKRFLRRGSGSIRSAIKYFQMDSIVVVMENYGKTLEELALFLVSLLHYRGLQVYPTGLGAG
ncbi:hypothetical protein KEJ49_06155, partial [Candidatus Bathyarchaeota archaeon]|nr:hypothetical protein [Candidatus Bathyarchaeota archaeon]